MGANLSYPTVDLSGKVAIVTGGNGGIGYETAKGIASMGAHTIIACRSEEKATAAIEQMKGEINKPVTLEYMPLDLASFDSTRNFTNSFKEKQLPLHILINNAGLVGPAQIGRYYSSLSLIGIIQHHTVI
jgi:NAD(P)-dependent dehydrogenase (short-subunit alcohol dehydrogenase family)